MPRLEVARIRGAQFLRVPIRFPSRLRDCSCWLVLPVLRFAASRRNPSITAHKKSRVPQRGSFVFPSTAALLFALISEKTGLTHFLTYKFGGLSPRNQGACPQYVRLGMLDYYRDDGLISEDCLRKHGVCPRKSGAQLPLLPSRLSRFPNRRAAPSSSSAWLDWRLSARKPNS